MTAGLLSHALSQIAVKAIHDKVGNLAQVLAEQEAWKIAKESGLDLVTILPNFVLGPILSTRTDGTSVGFLKVRHNFSAASIFLPCAGTPLQSSQ